MKFLITGANGFVGTALCAELLRRGHTIKAAVRSTHSCIRELDQLAVGAINEHTDWSVALQKVDIVMHLAARVHVMKDTAADPLAEFRKVNLLGTENLARQAASAGVKRLVYVSSIKVNGEQTTRSYTEQDTPNPQDPYGISKWEAEQCLLRIASASGLEVVIVRPPLVYGPGVKGNFIRLINALHKGMPLPLAGAKNARSLIYVANLVDALIACATTPGAAGQTYLVSDGKAVSTAELVEKIAQALEQSSHSFFIPPVLLRTAAALCGVSGQFNRLFGSLQITDAKLRKELGWAPPYTLEQGLSSTIAWYLKTQA